MPVQKSNGASPIVARHRATPVGVSARDAPSVGSIVARIVDNPATGLLRCGGGHTLEWISCVNRLAAGIGYVRDCRRTGNRSSTYAGPLRVWPGSKIAAPDAEIHSIIRDSQIRGTCGIHLDELFEPRTADRTKQEVRSLLIGQQEIKPGPPPAANC